VAVKLLKTQVQQDARVYTDAVRGISGNYLFMLGISIRDAPVYRQAFPEAKRSRNG